MSSGSSGRAGGWIATLLGGLVLAVVGLGAGMLAGGLWEAPDLVFHYLSGGTEEVALATPESGEATARGGLPDRHFPAPQLACSLQCGQQRLARWT